MSTNPRRKASTKIVTKHNLVTRIRGIWEGARTQAARSVNTSHVFANWLVGREIVEEEQEGRERAVYGKRMFKVLSARLTKELGGGFSQSFTQEYAAVFCHLS